MNFLKNLLGWIKARFEGATYSTRRSFIPAAVQSARFDAGKAVRMELMRKSRYFEKNNGLYNKCLDLTEAHTVGPGLQFIPSSSDLDWNGKISKLWKRWKEKPDKLSFQCLGSFLSQAVRAWLVDGDCFIVLTHDQSGTPKLMLVEGHLVETPPQFEHLEGKTIVDGVRIDPQGRPIGYYIATENAEKTKTYKLLPAEFVVHVFEPSRAGQYRGLPIIYPVINDLHDLDDLQLLEMDAARAAAEITNVVYNETGEIQSVAGMIRNRVTSSKTLGTGDSVAETRSEYYTSNVGGKTVTLMRGDKMEQFKSDRPGVAQREHWRYLAEKICNGFGLPYLLVCPETIQGTVFRGVNDEADMFFASRFSVIEDVCERIYRFFADYSIKTEPTLRPAPEDWDEVTVYKPRAVNVDQGRNASATVSLLEVGATNYEMIFGPLGLDWRDQFRKLKEQQDFAKQIGLELMQPAVAADQQTATAP